MAPSPASCRLSWEDTGWDRGGARRESYEAQLQGRAPFSHSLWSWVSAILGPEFMCSCTAVSPTCSMAWDK